MNMILTTFMLLSCLNALAVSETNKNQLLKLKSFAEIQGQFIQTKTLSELNVTIQTEGQFKINKGTDKKVIFYWNILKPSPSKICIDSEGIQISSNRPGGKREPKKIKFSETGPETTTQMLSFFKLLSLDEKSAQDFFFFRAEGKSFLLTPKNSTTSLFKTVHIEINHQGLIKNLQIDEKSTDKIEIHFFKLKTKNILTKSAADQFKCE